MRAFLVTNQKKLMHKLLAEDVFDDFLLAEAVVVKGGTLTIEGRDAEGVIQSYGSFKGSIFEFIKGKQTPSYMKFVLIRERTEGDIATRSLNILYRNGMMSITTGIAMDTFTPDRSAEHEWDHQAESFLAGCELETEFLG